MANHKSARKRIRANETKHLRNKYQIKSCRTAIKKLRMEKTKETASVLFNKVASMLDKAARKQVIHKNKAANTKARLSKYINAL
jgi:small subunit ribosomal protein S20